MGFRTVLALGMSLLVPPGAAWAQSAAQRDMMAGMERMDKAMAGAAMTGDPDADFARMMIPHHQGAIDMAEVELKYGKDAALRKLASRIVLDQEKEIDQMRRWLAAHP